MDGDDLRSWKGLELRIEQPEGWAALDDSSATVFESPGGAELRISPLDLPTSLEGALTERSLDKWGIWCAERMGLANPIERRAGTCPLGYFATYVYEDLNGGELPRAQLWFLSDRQHAFFVSLTGAATPEELASVQRVIDALAFEPIEKEG
jgi:hypothetical protein